MKTIPRFGNQATTISTTARARAQHPHRVKHGTKTAVVPYMEQGRLKTTPDTKPRTRGPTGMIIYHPVGLLHLPVCRMPFGKEERRCVFDGKKNNAIVSWGAQKNKNG